MRPMSLVLLSAGLLVAAEDATEVPKISLVPERIEQLGDLQFDDQGRPERESRTLTITMRPVVPEGVSVVSWGEPRLESAVAGNGDQLTLAPAAVDGDAVDFNRRVFRMNRQVRVANFAMNGFALPEEESLQPPLVLRLVPPQRPAFTIDRLVGTVPVTWRVGPAEEAAFKPMSTQPIDKPMPVPGVTDGTLTIVSRDAQQVVLRWSDAVEARMAGVRFEDADGAGLATRGSGTSSRNGVVDHSYRVALPDGGAVVLQLHPESKTADLPLLIEQLPLPGSDAVPPAKGP